MTDNGSANPRTTADQCQEQREEGPSWEGSASEAGRRRVEEVGQGDAAQRAVLAWAGT